MATPRKVMIGEEIAGKWVHGEWDPGDIVVDPDGNPIGGGAGQWNDSGGSPGFLSPIAGANKMVVVGRITTPDDPNAIMQIDNGNLQINSSWNGGHFVMGVSPNDFHLWVDANEQLRFKKGAPGSDLDGELVGTQS